MKIINLDMDLIIIYKRIKIEQLISFRENGTINMKNGQIFVKIIKSEYV